jgi:hypothetical protein
MRWKTKPLKPTFTQAHSEIVFAWTPKDCEDGYTRWLCFVEVKKEDWEPALQRFMTVRYYKAVLELGDPGM